MRHVAVTTRALRTVILAARTNRSNRLRRQGRIPKSDSDVKEAHRRTYQDNESLRSVSVPLVQEDQLETTTTTTTTTQGGAGQGLDTGSNVATPLSSALPSSLSSSLSSSSSPGAPPDQTLVPSTARAESDDVPQRLSKAAILIDILSAPPMNIESTIAHHADQIDPELLHLLEGRIAAARQLEQDDETVQGLIALYHRLKSEYERRTASPALRLLDTLISMMMADEEEEEDGKARTRDGHRSREDTIALVRARMQLAFDDSLSLDTDIFTVAQQLAVGERRFVDELINEQVDAGEFIGEVEHLLKRAVEQQVAGKAMLELGGNNGSDTGVDVGGPGERERLRQVLEQREKTIECVEELLVLARNVWLHRK